MWFGSTLTQWRICMKNYVRTLAHNWILQFQGFTNVSSPSLLDDPYQTFSSKKSVTWRNLQFFYYKRKTWRQYLSIAGFLLNRNIFLQSTCLFSNWLWSSFFWQFSFPQKSRNCSRFWRYQAHCFQKESRATYQTLWACQEHLDLPWQPSMDQCTGKT